MEIKTGDTYDEIESIKPEEDLSSSEESAECSVSASVEKNSSIENVVVIEDSDVSCEPREKKQIDIEVNSTTQRLKLILELTWPALAENILTSIMSMTGMVMVSGLGSYAISAIGLVNQPKFIMMAAFMALAVGTTALVARFKGARDPESANLVLKQSLIITISLVLVLCGAMLVFCEPLIRGIAGSNISEQTITAGVEYFRIQIFGFPALALTYTINAALRGAGNTRASFYNNSAANIVNIFMNYCLIYGNLGFPALGVAGSSLATVIGQLVGLMMASYVLMSGRQYIRLRFRTKWKLDFPMIKRIVNIGLPALIEQVIMRTGMLWFTVIVTSLGDKPYAAHMVAMNIQSFSFTTGMAFGISSTTLVGQSLGRMRADLAKAYVRLTQNIGYIVSIGIAALLFFGRYLLSGMYSDDPEIVNLAATMLMIIAFSNPISNARFVYVSALRGAGDSRFMAVVTFIGVLLIRPLVSLLLVNVFTMGLAGVWIALVSDSVVCFTMSYIRYRNGKWALLRV